MLHGFASNRYDPTPPWTGPSVPPDTDFEMVAEAESVTGAQQNNKLGTIKGKTFDDALYENPTQYFTMSTQNPKSTSEEMKEFHRQSNIHNFEPYPL